MICWARFEAHSTDEADLECTAADGVSLIFIFFMSCSKSQLVNEVEGNTHLLPLNLLAVPVPFIHLADVIHIVLQVRKGRAWTIMISINCLYMSILSLL